MICLICNPVEATECVIYKLGIKLAAPLGIGASTAGSFSLFLCWYIPVTCVDDRFLDPPRAPHHSIFSDEALCRSCWTRLCSIHSPHQVVHQGCNKNIQKHRLQH